MIVRDARAPTVSHVEDLLERHDIFWLAPTCLCMGMVLTKLLYGTWRLYFWIQLIIVKAKVFLTCSLSGQIIEVKLRCGCIYKLYCLTALWSDITLIIEPVECSFNMTCSIRIKFVPPAFPIDAVLHHWPRVSPASATPQYLVIRVVINYQTFVCNLPLHQIGLCHGSIHEVNHWACMLLCHHRVIGRLVLFVVCLVPLLSVL